MPSIYEAMAEHIAAQREAEMPRRKMLRNSPTATWGWALPNVGVPNVYRGPLQPEGALPETMTRDIEQWLRGA